MAPGKLLQLLGKVCHFHWDFDLLAKVDDNVHCTAGSQYTTQFLEDNHDFDPKNCFRTLEEGVNGKLGSLTPQPMVGSPLE